MGAEPLAVLSTIVIGLFSAAMPRAAGLLRFLQMVPEVPLRVLARVSVDGTSGAWVVVG